MRSGGTVHGVLSLGDVQCWLQVALYPAMLQWRLELAFKQGA